MWKAVLKKPKTKLSSQDRKTLSDIPMFRKLFHDVMMEGRLYKISGKAELYLFVLAKMVHFEEQ